MKKFLLSALIALSSISGSQAANLYSSNLGNGLTVPGVSGGLAAGTVRFGVFPANFDFAANATNFAALDAAFIEVTGFSGPLTVADTNGFYHTSTSYTAGGNYDGASYADDIAGEKIYVWVLNETVAANSTLHAVFSTDQVWVQPDALIQDSIVSPDSGSPGLQAHIGVLAGGQIIGADLRSHQMGMPIPITAVTISRNPATAVVNVEVPVTFTAEITGVTTGPYTFKWRKNGEIVFVVEETLDNNQFTIPSTVVGDTGTYDVLVSNTTSTDIASDTNQMTVSTKPAILTQPQPTVLAEGATLNLSVDAVGPGTLKFQWKKGANIVGATTEQLSLPNMSLKQAGAYSFTVTNAPGAGTATVNSNKVEVVVVGQTENTVVAAVGAKALLTAVIAGKGATYQWFKDGSLTPLANGADYTGVTTTKLSVLAVQGDDSGDYYCAVTVNGTTVNSGMQTLNVFTAAPELDEGSLLLMPNGEIGSTYTYQIPLLGGSSQAATAYTAKGLPAGLKLNTKTGLITGRPTKATVGDVTVTFTAANKISKDTATASIAIVASPELAGLAGVYVSSIDRNTASGIYGAELGGRFDMTVTTLGAISGKLVLGATSLSVKGFIELDGLLPTSEIVVLRPGNLTPLTISLTIDGNLISGSISDSVALSDLDFDGYRNIYKKSSNEPTAFLGQYNFIIELDEEDEDLLTDATLPQGAGYGTFTVAADGKLSVKGKTADGEAYTTASFLSPTGDVIIFQTLYKTVQKGSILGNLVIDGNKLIAGFASQLRPADPSTKQRTYAAGFDLTAPADALIISGGAYTAPTSKILLDEDVNAIAELEFIRGVEEAAAAAEADITLLANFKLTVGANTAKTKLAISSKTGLITGSFSLADKRASKFTGVVIPEGNRYIGVGSYLLPTAVGTTSSIVSGLMVLEVPVP